MGAVAPAPDFGPEQWKDFDESILKPTLQGMIAEAMDYRGFIFFGLMVKNKSCYLLEYNVRLGDPETQTVLPLMTSDFAALCLAIGKEGLADFPLAWKDGAVCSPVAVAEGYPGSYRRGDPIAIDSGALEKAGGRIFIAGAEEDGNSLRTSGGRVLVVSAYGTDGTEARERAYKAIKAVNFAGMDYRGDIGNEILSPLQDTNHG